MNNIQRRIVVRFVHEGFHCWPEAPAHRSYLANKHRHLFHVVVTVQVQHNDREVEFHDLLDLAKGSFGGGPDVVEFGRSSCEDLAEALLQKITLRYPDRSVAVAVYEDGEVGAEVLYSPSSAS